MANKKILCNSCKFYIDNKCEHESNICIELHRKIEKRAYISLETKTECKFYE